MTKNRRDFIKKLSMGAAGLSLMAALPSYLFAEEKKKKFDFKISLAQWSLHKALFSKKLSALDFPVTAKKDFGAEGVEYVNQFFSDKAKDMVFLKSLKQRADENGIKNILIMIDGEGSLADKDQSKRIKAVENHYKWVEAAKYLDCHSIRVNLHGEGTESEWKNASVDSLGRLSEFGAKNKINVIVENHGSYSSNGKLLSEVIRQVNNKSCGTLPDFGNFCFRREKGDLWESPCVEFYDKYKGVEEMLPYAKGVSAKSFDFDAEGNETTIDFRKMLSLVKASGYQGYIGIEYEGERMSEEDGIRATKKLLEKVRAELA
ncbi:MAG: sugar phosphate isomerase/epimerase family protein [Cytophagaceae bacterium]